ncbi:hypothetical protein [Paenibacillus sp. IITD108]|uniref:hypothetical protein n=1 Tax=Paenibacillus sp. IITD108 TaxID=3116649 RepID=UPI002F420313
MSDREIEKIAFFKQITERVTICEQDWDWRTTAVGIPILIAVPPFLLFVAIIHNESTVSILSATTWKLANNKR